MLRQYHEDIDTRMSSLLANETIVLQRLVTIYVRDT